MVTICNKKSHFDVEEFRKETVQALLIWDTRMHESMNRGGLRNSREFAENRQTSQLRHVGRRKPCYNRGLVQWRYRLGVRTEDSQSSNPGSIPGSATSHHPPLGAEINGTEGRHPFSSGII